MNHAGVTGTQSGATQNQVARFTAELWDSGVSALHHGDCVGADEQACEVARSLSLRLICHPPTIENKRAYVDSDHYHEPLHYLERNKEIVRSSKVLFALPKELTEIQRSGTWATVRAARKIGVPVVTIWPDGTVSRS